MQYSAKSLTPNQDDLLKKLNVFYQTEPYEKFPEYNISKLLNGITDEILGQDYRKSTISARKAKLIYDIFLEKVQQRYGRFANITNFKTIGTGIRFKANFEQIFKSKVGKLYGIKRYNDLLLTEHALIRFEERFDTDECPELIDYIDKDLTKVQKASPTVLDIMNWLIKCSPNEIAFEKDDIYLFNIGIGYLVVRQMSDIFVVLTFLTYDMNVVKLDWQRKQQKDTFKELIDAPGQKIEKLETYVPCT